MGRHKTQHLKQRKDGRYCAVYQGIHFMGNSEDEAKAKRDEYIEAQKNGLLPKSVVDYASQWLPIAYPAVADSTYRELAIHLEKLAKHLGSTLISDVTPLQIKEIYSTYYKGLSKSYIDRGKQIFCAFFDSAIAEGFCRTNPARDRTAKPHKGTIGGHRAITEEERTWIRTYCKDHRAHAAVMTMLYAGIRPPEAKAMIIENSVDFDNETITLKEFAHLDGYYNYKVTSDGKTDRAARTIPLFEPLKETLQGRTGYLIPDPHGEMVNVQSWRNTWNSYKTCMETAINHCHKRWYRKTKEHKKILAEAEKLRKAGKKKEAAAKEAEIPPWREFTVVPYDLRHSFCTMCRDNGVELNTCVRWMGHADAKMILKIYDEVSENRSKAEAEKLRKKLR